MTTFQCPYFLRPCPLVSIPDEGSSSLPLDAEPSRPPPSPLTLLPSSVSFSQLAPPSLPSHTQLYIPLDEEPYSNLPPTLYSSYPSNSSVEDYSFSSPFSSAPLPFPSFSPLSNPSPLDLIYDQSPPSNLSPIYTSPLIRRDASSNNDLLSSTTFSASSSFDGEDFGIQHGFQGGEGSVSWNALGNESEGIATRRVGGAPLHDSDSARGTEFGEGLLLGQQTSFVSKLWHILTHDEYERYLRWSKDGTSMILVDPEKFAEDVIPRFFRHSKLSSFTRQLNTYSFQRCEPDVNFDASISPSQILPVNSIDEGSSPCTPNNYPPSHDEGSCSRGRENVAIGFSHPYFQRNHPELLSQVRPRVAVRKKRSASGPSPPGDIEENPRGGKRRR